MGGGGGKSVPTQGGRPKVQKCTGVGGLKSRFSSVRTLWMIPNMLAIRPYIFDRHNFWSSIAYVYILIGRLTNGMTYECSLNEMLGQVIQEQYSAH